MHTLKSKRWRIVILALICIVMVIGWLLRPPERRLLKRAHKVADARIQAGNGFCWLPNDEVLLFSFVHNSWALSHLEGKSGMEMPLSALSALYNRIGAGEGGEPSPDGRRLLWRGGHNAVFEAALDGSGFTRWTMQPKPGVPFWLPDSRHWCEVVYSSPGDSRQYLIIHSLNEQSEPPVVIHQPPTLTYGCDGMSVTLRQTLLIATRNPHLNGNAVETISEYRIEPSLVLLRRFSIAMPPGAEIGNVRFDRLGKRIGWEVRFPKRPKQPRFWGRCLRLIHAQDTLPAVQSLWVSDVDGSRLHEVGYMVPTDMQSDFSVFDWMPDGKHLWFVSGWYSKAGDEWFTQVYTVPPD